MQLFETPSVVETIPVARDISTELWREYDFEGRVYRIDLPSKLYVGATCHRVVDVTGLVHCVPAPGHHGCVLRWQIKGKNRPVNF